MKRHRKNYVRFIQQGAAAAFEPAHEARREIEPVAMLEGQDRPTAVLVIAHDGTRPVKGRWPRMAAGTEGLAAGIELERKTAAGAHRAVEKLDLVPAGGAERTRLGNLCAAGDAERRKQQIERRPASASETALQSPAHVL